MLIIRLRRIGKKNQPSFRLVLTDSRKAAKSGGFLEVLGSHDRLLKRTQLKEERIRYWLSKGVQVSDTVHNLLVNAAILSGPKKDVSSKKKSEVVGGKPTEEQTGTPEAS